MGAGSVNSLHLSAFNDEFPDVAMDNTIWKSSQSVSQFLSVANPIFDIRNECMMRGLSVSLSVGFQYCHLFQNFAREVAISGLRIRAMSTFLNGRKAHLFMGSLQESEGLNSGKKMSLFLYFYFYFFSGFKKLKRRMADNLLLPVRDLQPLPSVAAFSPTSPLLGQVADQISQCFSLFSSHMALVFKSRK